MIDNKIEKRIFIPLSTVATTILQSAHNPTVRLAPFSRKEIDFTINSIHQNSARKVEIPTGFAGTMSFCVNFMLAMLVFPFAGGWWALGFLVVVSLVTFQVFTNTYARALHPDTLMQHVANIERVQRTLSQPPYNNGHLYAATNQKTSQNEVSADHGPDWSQPVNTHHPPVVAPPKAALKPVHPKPKPKVSTPKRSEAKVHRKQDRGTLSLEEIKNMTLDVEQALDNIYGVDVGADFVDKIDSVRNQMPSGVIKAMHKLRKLRNKAMHERGTLNKRQIRVFRDSYERAISHIQQRR